LPPITSNWFKVLIAVFLADTERRWTRANGKCCLQWTLPQVIYIDFCDSLFCCELHFWRVNYKWRDKLHCRMQTDVTLTWLKASCPGVTSHLLCGSSRRCWCVDARFIW
jgi:hypothetical protein